jgi:signal transduction histidine kinase/HAMP domain-containing protein
MVFSAVSLVLLEDNIENGYQSIATNITNEYQFGENALQLIATYESLVQNIADPGLTAQYQANIDKINAAASNLSGVSFSGASSDIYQRLRNEVALLEGYTTKGIVNAKQDNFSQNSDILEQVMGDKESIQQDMASLIVSYVSDQQQEEKNLAKIQIFAQTIGVMTIIVIAIGIIFLAIFFSDRLSRPIMRLAELAEKISVGGTLTTRVDEDLMRTKNEVGSLARSFDRMVRDVEKRVDDRTQALRQERARLLASINSLPIGFLLLDNADGVLISNRIVQGLFPQKDLTLASISKLFVPPFDVGELDRSLKEKQSYELQEIKLGERSFHLMALPVILSRSDQEDETIGSVVIMEDITRERMLDQSKDAFLAIAAHEMRTPLTVIRGNAELLLDEPSIIANVGLKTQIDSVLNSAVRLLGIVNDFLDVQNLEGGRVALHVEPVDVAWLLRDTVRDLSVLADKKGLTLTINIPPDLNSLMLDLDKFRLQQIYVNLISNAIHYTEQGSVTVSLGKEKDFVKILFEDTGIGISKEDQGRLFQKFETGRVFLKSREYGSGLGLYISRFLAHLLGGDLVLEKSDVLKGSVFCLKLPLGRIPGNGNSKKF